MNRLDSIVTMQVRIEPERTQTSVPCAMPDSAGVGYLTHGANTANFYVDCTKQGIEVKLLKTVTKKRAEGEHHSYLYRYYYELQ